MPGWNSHRFARRYPHLKIRQAVIRAIRAHFDAAGFDEVETPILQTAPGYEVHLSGFSTRLYSADRTESSEKWLHTSPELAMKKLLAAGVEKMYQICHVFRNAEGSSRHSPEFTMIEWYRSHADYRVLMEDCVALLRCVARAAGVQEFAYRGATADPFAEFEYITLDQAFRRYAGIALSEFLGSGSAADLARNRDGFAAAAAGQGVRIVDSDEWDDIFFAVLDELIEPKLGLGRPGILYDYPAHMAALSRRKSADPRWAERFELYVCGLELANAFSELTDPVEQRARIDVDMAEKERLYGYRWPVDEDFLKALSAGMPPCAGIALGVDRLVMLAAQVDDIQDVLWLGV